MSQNADIKEIVADVREQMLYLQELGVESLDVHLSEIPPEIEKAVPIVPAAAYSPPPEFEHSRPPETFAFVKREPPALPQAGSRLSSLPSLSTRPSRFFDKYNPAEPGDSISGAQANEPPNPAAAADTLFKVSPTLPVPDETIDQIRAEIGKDCTRCKLSGLGRSRVVNSVGNFDADLMFVGEAPGADEDRLGEPFVGRAGQLLTDIMKAIGFDRESVFIGNINRCRPPGNRAPEPDESAVCKPFLVREIAVVRPRVIVVLGATAAQNLLDTKTPISKMRGHFHDYLGVKVMPTFHPAYLLRDPNKKREVWEDMKKVRDYLKN